MAEQLIILEGVSWETYERLMADTGPKRRKYFTYDAGNLQIVVPSLHRECPNRLLASIVEILAEEWELNIDGSGSMTVRRADLRKGFEPDSSFYLRNVAAVRGKDELDFMIDPPPDLVIDVNTREGSINRVPIFAAVGVPESWRYDSSDVRIYLNRNGIAAEAAVSEMLPPLSGKLLTSFLKAGLEEDRPQWIRRLRKWAREARPSAH